MDILGDLFISGGSLSVSGDVGVGHTINFNRYPSGGITELTVLDDSTNNDNMLKLTTENGKWLKFGPGNTAWCHFNTDANNGFYFTNRLTLGNGQINAYTGSDFKLLTNGTTRLFVDQSNGNVGIGNDHPSHELAVTGSISASTKIISSALQITTSPTNNHVLTSDGIGNATWQALPADNDAQTLSFNEDTDVISISNGNSVDISNILYWTSGSTGTDSIKTKAGNNSSKGNNSIAFGSGNTAHSSYSLAGGYVNSVSGDTSFGFTKESKISADTSTIIGGKIHKITGATDTSIMGGNRNVIDAQYAKCPDGYGISIGGEICVSAETNQNLTTYDAGPIVVAAAQDMAFGVNGTSFYSTTLDGVGKPYTVSGSTSTMREFSTGVVIPANDSITSGTLWDNHGASTNGRLNACGVWSGTSTGSQNYYVTLGFSTCIDIIETGIYSIGLAADNETKFYIDAELVYNSFDLNNDENDDLNRWKVLEFDITSGRHIIEMMAYNHTGPASFGAEIYNAPCSTLSGLTTTAQLEPYIFWSTKDLTGGSVRFDYAHKASSGNIYEGQDHWGYKCPDGFALDCGKEFCIKQVTTSPTLAQTGDTLNSAIIAGNKNAIKESDNAVVVGGNRNYVELKGDNSVVIGGEENRVSGKRSVIIGGKKIIGGDDDTVYTPNIIISGTTTLSGSSTIIGQMKYTFGTPGAGKVLTSDTDGDISWATPSSGTDDQTLAEVLTEGNTANDNQYIAIDKIQARDSGGLALYEDSGLGLFVEDGGQVGVGENTPTAKLHVGDPGTGNISLKLDRASGQPSIKSTDNWLIMDNIDNGTAVALNYYVDDNVILAYGSGNGGNVGIRTTSPIAPLHVVSNTDLGDAVVLEFSGTSNGGPYLTFQYNEHGFAPSETGDLWGGIRGRGAHTSGTYAGYGASIEFRQDGTLNGTSTPAAIVFKTTDDGTTVLDERLRITNSGRVGINKASPTSTLHLNGSVSAKYNWEGSNYTATESDYFIVMSNGSGRNVVLPDASTCAERIYVIKRGGTGGVSICTSGTDSIDGATSHINLSAQYDVVTVQSDGTNVWFITSCCGSYTSHNSGTYQGGGSEA